MGAGGALIDAAYQAHASYMLPVFESPERIDDKTFWKHLGKRECVSILPCVSLCRANHCYVIPGSTPRT